MSSDIENLTENAEKLSTDPIYDTNWCDMPAEIKLKCIGKLELKERLSLRCTAKTEKSLVDSRKIKIQRCGIHGSPGFRFVLLTSENGNTCHRAFRNANEKFKFLKYIWKIGVFEKLYIWLEGEDSKEKLMKYTGTIAAREIDFHFKNNGVESITMNANSNPTFPIDKILGVTQVQNVPYWHIANCYQIDCLRKIAQMWIDKNSKVGCTFQASAYEHRLFEEFSGHFVNRILSTSEKRIRIRTNNPGRHILLERGLDDVVTIDWLLQFYRLMVIPAEMKESEYDDNCKEWICRINPGAYDDDYDDDIFDNHW